MFDRPADNHQPEPFDVALDARVDQLAALLRDVFDRLQLNLYDPDLLRAVNTTQSYLYAVLLGLVETDPHGIATHTELATHHAAFQRIVESHT